MPLSGLRLLCGSMDGWGEESRNTTQFSNVKNMSTLRASWLSPIGSSSLIRQTHQPSPHVDSSKPRIKGPRGGRGHTTYSATDSIQLLTPGA